MTEEIRTAHRAFEALKSTLEYLHLTEFLLHVSQSEVMSLLLMALTAPQGWIVLSAAAAVGLVWVRLRDSSREAGSQGAGETPDRLAQKKHKSPVVMDLASDVPRTLKELASQGVAVRIVIELTPDAWPAPRRHPSRRVTRHRAAAK